MAAKSSKRIVGIDALRGIAIILMVIFHFVWNLGEFRVVSYEFLESAPWRRFGACILGMFVSIAGFVSFWHWQKSFTWSRFFSRIWKVAGAALLISIGSFTVSKVQGLPYMFIFFGILHHITLGLILLALIRKFPTWLLVLIALGCFLAPIYCRHEFFNHPVLWWVGLCTKTPVTVDYVTLLPWFWIMIVGAILARHLPEQSVLNWAGHPSLDNRFVNGLAWMGKYSLIIYLVHQPILYGATFLWFSVFK